MVYYFCIKAIFTGGIATLLLSHSLPSDSSAYSNYLPALINFLLSTFLPIFPFSVPLLTCCY